MEGTQLRESVAADEAVVQIQEDYFGFGATEKHFMPDGVSYLEFKIMNEGERRDFQKKTNRDITFNRGTNDARIKADPAEERHQLITTSVTGWNFKRGGEPVSFSKGTPGSTLEQWLKVANPKLVDDLEFAIRKANPWMQAEMTVEEIDKEMARLADLREQVLEREKGEGSSSSR